MIKTAREDKVVLYILSAGFLVQLISSFLTIGAYHPDAHFHIVEYSMYQQGLPSAVPDLWERTENMMPSLKMYMFTAYYKFMNFLNITNRYDILTILRILIGSANLLLFNYIIIRNISKENKTALYAALIILNFSWCFPYVRTSFSAEMIGGVIFFAALLLYDVWNEKQPLNFFKAALIGLILSMAFYARFQIAFAGLGYIAWLVFFRKETFKVIAFMAIGFGLGLAVNIGLDSLLYGELAISPWNYYRINIIEGKAASFGTSSVLFYIIELAVILLAPLLSVFLFLLACRGAVKYFRDPYVLSVIVFLIGHSIVGHKEDRFLFPVFGILPLIVGYAMQGYDYKAWFKRQAAVLRVSIWGVLIFSLLLNTFALVMLMVVPYSQGIEFGYRFVKRFKNAEEPVLVYNHRRTPFQSISKNTLYYYQGQLNENVQFITSEGFPEIPDDNPEGRERYICTTYNQLHSDPNNLPLAAKYTPVLYSSKLMWNLNEWLRKKGANTVSEIWIMYRVEPE